MLSAVEASRFIIPAKAGILLIGIQFNLEFFCNYFLLLVKAIIYCLIVI